MSRVDEGVVPTFTAALILDARRGPVLTVEGAATYCGLSKQTMYNLQHEGKGPVAFKNGTRTVYYPFDLEAWLKARLVLAGDSALAEAPDAESAAAA